MQIRPLRGRALIRRSPEEHGEYTLPSGIIVPANVDPERGSADAAFYSQDGNDRPKRRNHRGTIVALGPPAFEHSPRPKEGYEGVERPWLCSEGDEVLYVYGIALEKVRTFEDHVWVAQEEILGVIDAVQGSGTRPGESSQTSEGTTAHLQAMGSRESGEDASVPEEVGAGE